MKTCMQIWKRTETSVRIYILIILFRCTNEAETEAQYPSCSFNPWCTCSSLNTNLGIVTCMNVPLLKMPAHLNRSKMNSFYLESNGLKMIEPHFFMGTGLHVLKISRNPIHNVPTEIFKGLENTLRDLEMSYLDLVQVPRTSLFHLQKLQHLNLAGNKIVDVSQNNWLNIKSTLETLILRENSITHVPAYAFERFIELKVLDLSKNVLTEIDPNAFFPDTRKLIHLYLEDNHLRHIPYSQLQHFSAVKTLDLSRNFITKIEALAESTRTEVNVKFSLNILNLKYNDLTTLTLESFGKFETLNYTFLDGNPITYVENNVFQNVRIKELSFSDCGLTYFHADMIQGLEQSLASLDLSYNNLMVLDANIFRYFYTLRQFKVSGNMIEGFSTPDRNGNIVDLDITGSANTNYETLLRDISHFVGLIRLSISNVEMQYIGATHFIGYSFGIEELSLRNAYLKSVDEGAFTQVRGLKKLDLSDNEITDIHEHAFDEIGHSLNYLHLANGFADSVKIFPHEAFTYLRNLRKLDVSFNHFEELPAVTLHEMPYLEILRAHDCRLKTLKRETFQNDVHGNLREATFSFNQLRILKSYSFSDLPELRYLNFEDNLIETIESQALRNLRKLRWIYLRGNRINTIQRGAFVNLPQLELLDLAYNNLKNFHFVCLDSEVGSNTLLSLNLTFNRIYELDIYKDLESTFDELSVEILDLSYNSISMISADYFTPLGYSLTHLFLTQNLLRNVSKDVFRHLVQLQWLDISDNKLQYIEDNALGGVRTIQILNFSRNDLVHLPLDFFSGMKSLRIVDLSYNRLTSLPDRSFRENSLEKILLANNNFVKVPFRSFSAEVAKSLKEIDVSNNKIASIHMSESLFQFESLLYLNISGNLLTKVEESLFSYLTKLLYLDLSHNHHLRFADAGRGFIGVQENLAYLGLNNISLTKVPDLPLPNLAYLFLSQNNISTLSPESAQNLTSVRVLDLSKNNFTSLPVALLSMKSLRMLDISENNISVLLNDSLLNGFVELDELHMTKLPLTTFETGVLNRLQSLRTLRLTTNEDIDHFNIPKILEKNRALRCLQIEVTTKYLNSEMYGTFPKKLQKITITGQQLDSVDSKILVGITSPELEVVVHGTKIQTLNRDVYGKLYHVKNISLDVRHNSINHLSNPITVESPYLNNHTFLLKIKISSNPWTCDCDVGWIEAWGRMARKLFCGSLEFSTTESAHACMKTEDDLRETLCVDGKFLLETMETELECGWNRSSYSFQINVEYFLIIFLIWICDIS